MEVKLSALMLVVLGLVTFGLVASEPQPLWVVQEPTARELAQLEDAFASHHAELPLARRLATEYLRLGLPALAVGVVRQVAPELAADPVLTHRLAQGYEALGRLHDAIATAHLARVRCEQAVGSAAVPAYGLSLQTTCSAGALVALEQHEDALLQMLRWGVEDPRSDSRARLAHRLAGRRARIASAQLDASAAVP